MQGGWRLPALLPLGVVIQVLVVTMQGVGEGSHLGPPLLMLLTPVLFRYPVGLLALRQWVQHRSTVPAP